MQVGDLVSVEASAQDVIRGQLVELSEGLATIQAGHIRLAVPVEQLTLVQAKVEAAPKQRLEIKNFLQLRAEDAANLDEFKKAKVSIDTQKEKVTNGQAEIARRTENGSGS